MKHRTSPGRGRREGESAKERERARRRRRRRERAGRGEKGRCGSKSRGVLVAERSTVMRDASRLLFAPAHAVPSLSAASALAHFYRRRYARADPSNAEAARALEAIFARVCAKWEAQFRADAYAACSPALASLEPAAHAAFRAKLGAGPMPSPEAAAAAAAPKTKRCT